MSASPAPSADPASDLEHILSLAKAERDLRNGPGWGQGPNFEATIDAHSEAVENLYDALYKLLDERTRIGDPVQKKRMPPDPRKELKAQIVKRVRDELPSLVASIIDEF